MVRDPFSTSVGRPCLAELFFTPDEVAGPLNPAGWTVLVAEARPRATVDPEGRDIVIRDTVVRASVRLTPRPARASRWQDRAHERRHRPAVSNR